MSGTTTTGPFAGAVGGTIDTYSSATGTLDATTSDMSDSFTISFDGSSVAVGGTVTLDIDGAASLATYEGYYLNNGVEDPLVFAYQSYGLLGETSLGTYTITQAAYTACYVRGTLIATATGEAAVEALAAGDGVLTVSGAVRPVKWIGRRGYAGRFLAANPNVQPVRFHAGSLGDNLPRRDLLVSPEHAMFLDGMLIPARCLVNGTTITRERGLADVDYFHVELDSHDVILAEGAASETFLDDGSRGKFDNAHEFAAMYPSAAPTGGFLAPRVEHGPRLDAVRRNLDRDDVQDVRIDAEGSHRIAIRDDARVVRLVTPASYAPGDARRLGAAVNRVRLDDFDLALDDPRLATGWHSREGGWRWTDGAALVLTSGARRIEVTVAAVAVAAAA